MELVKVAAKEAKKVLDEVSRTGQVPSGYAVSFRGGSEVFRVGGETAEPVAEPDQPEASGDA